MAQLMPPGECLNDSLMNQDTSGWQGRTYGAVVPFDPYFGAHCFPTSVDYKNLYSQQASFVPENNVISPPTVTKNIKVRFIVMENNPNSPNQTNFRPQNLPDLQYIIDTLNIILGDLIHTNVPATSVCGSCYIKDTRFRVKLKGVDFVTNTENYKIHSGWTMFGVENDVINNKQLGNGMDSVLNIFLFTDSSAANYVGQPDSYLVFYQGGWMPGGINVLSGPTSDVNKSIFLFNTYMSAITYPLIHQGTYHSLLRSEAKHLLHELGHSLGLGHIVTAETRDTSARDFLPDIFPFGIPFPSGALDTVFNIMNKMDNSIYRPYLTPLQIGRCIRDSYLGRVSKYIYPTEAPDMHPWVIDKNEVWDFPIRMYQNIVVTSGNTLTIKCLVQMPPNSHIIVQKNAKLIVEGGRITSYNDHYTWGGIEVEGHRGLPAESLFQGTAILKDSAYIVRANRGIRNFVGDPFNGAEGGGLINADNAIFLNCNRAVELINFPFYNYGYGGCMFTNDLFKWDDTSITFDPVGLMTSFEIKGGLRIYNCHFENDIPLTKQAQVDRGTMIHFEATAGKISGNVFDGFYRAIANEGYNGTPTRRLEIYNNHFNHTTNNILFAAGGYGYIKGNEFTNMYNSFGNGNMGIRPGHAVYLDNSFGDYVGCENIIHGGIDDPSVLWQSEGRRGIIVNNSDVNNTFIIDNQMDSLYIGLQTQYNNPNLYLMCNTHNYNDFAWLINPLSSGSNNYLKNQGTGCAPYGIRAHNAFNNSQVYDIASYLNNPWDYYTWSNTGALYPSMIYGSVMVYPCQRTNGGDDPSHPCSTYLHTYCYNIVISTHDLDSLIGIYNGMTTSQQANTLMGQFLFNFLIRGFNDLDDDAGLVTFLENQHTNKARRLLLPLYVYDSSYNLINPTIDSMQLGPDETAAYADYYNLLATLQQQGRTALELTEVEKAQVEGIAADSFAVSSFAKGLLSFAYGEKWIHPIEDIPVGADLYQSKAESTKDTTISFLGQAVPNPAKNQVKISVFITQHDANLHPALVILSITGRKMHQTALKVGKNTITINTQRWASGNYFYSFKKNGKVVDTKQLSVIK